jgi:peroxiredoxin
MDRKERFCDVYNIAGCRCHIITIVFVLAAIVGQAQVHYRIEGNLGNTEISGKMMVKDWFSNEIFDSVNVINGRIEPIEGTIPDCTICILQGSTNTRICPIFLGGGTTNIENVSITLGFRPMQSGAPLCDDYAKYLGVVQQATREMMMRKLSSEKREFNTKLNADVSLRISNVAKDIITRHHSDVLGWYLLFVDAKNYIQPADWLTLAEKMEPWLKDKAMFKTYEYDKSIMEAAAHTSVGCKFVDVETEVDGNTFKLSDYVGRGNYVVVDYWGATCAPCIAEFPDFKQIYQQYASHRVTVLGIPNDKDINKSRMAIEKYQLPYPQLLNTKDKFTKAYGIASMPLTIVFAPDGTIIARELNMDELKAKLNEIFPDNK